MDNTFVVFRKFQTFKEAEELQDFLQKNEISARLNQNSPPVDITFTGQTAAYAFELLIHQSDFTRAELAIKHEIQDSITVGDIENDYYLYQFTNEELYDILSKPDEWGDFDYILAKKILQERGNVIDESYILSLKQDRLTALSAPIENQQKWVVLGYIFAVFGGLLGIIIGYVLASSKKTLPTGAVIYAYSERDRLHGRNIFLIGLPIFLLSLFFRIYQQIV
ncbi:hypothetical protein [Sphingobacterium sp. LRF_L2]|uniref:hypothetical protein n=1 Tax=Sphingobacterium sp. LRF_L2 TaxID=3369421 RepID=UPI003F6138E3